MSRPLDNPYKRLYSKKSYKNRKFNGKRTTTDEYSGNKVHYSDRGVNAPAILKEFRHFATKDTSHIDHITPVAKIEKMRGVSEKRKKKITNRDYNLALTNEQLNESKRDMSNAEYLILQMKKGKQKNPTTTYNMLRTQLKSSVGICTDMDVARIIEGIEKITQREIKLPPKFPDITAGDVTAAAIDGGGGILANDDTAAFIITEGIFNIIKVSQGEIDTRAALKNMRKFSEKQMLIGAGSGAMTAILEKGFGVNATLVLSKSNDVMQVATMIYEPFCRYLGGNINGEEFYTEISTKAAATIINMICRDAAQTMIPIPIVGAVIGSLIATTVNTIMIDGVMSIRNLDKMSDAQLSQIGKIANQAIAEMNYHQELLTKLFNDDLDKFANTTSAAFDEILLAALENDFEKMSGGLDILLKACNSQAQLIFNTEDEVINWLNSEYREINL